MKWLIPFLILGNALFAELSVVEIPLRIEYEYAKRIPGDYEFHIVFRDPKGRIVSIPESRLQEFVEIAIDVGHDQQSISGPDQAVTSTALATITIEHTGELRFWDGWTRLFITWDDDHPAPLRLLNDELLVVTALAGDNVPPAAPQNVTAKQ